MSTTSRLSPTCAPGNVPFAEFQWANFFRARIPARAVSHWEAAVDVVFRRAATPEASKLLGYAATPVLDPDPAD